MHLQLAACKDICVEEKGEAISCMQIHLGGREGEAM